MKIVVNGGTGLVGSKTVAILRQGGHEVVAASPKSGINSITGGGLKEAMAGAQVDRGGRAARPAAPATRELGLAVRILRPSRGLASWRMLERTAAAADLGIEAIQGRLDHRSIPRLRHAPTQRR
jgi:hypothetical protein